MWTKATLILGEIQKTNKGLKIYVNKLKRLKLIIYGKNISITSFYTGNTDQ